MVRLAPPTQTFSSLWRELAPNLTSQSLPGKALARVGQDRVGIEILDGDTGRGYLFVAGVLSERDRQREAMETTG